MTEKALSLSPGRVTAWSRVVLAAFALSAIYLDPTQPASNARLTYTLLAIYVFYSCIALLLPHQGLKHWTLLFLHGLDIAFFALLMHLTEGPTSPFFVFFMFILLSATLQWNSAGAIWTSVALIVLLLALTLAAVRSGSSDDAELNRVVIRGAYLLVAGMLLAYVGAVRERDRRRLAKLASWPREEAALGETPALDRSLAHAADVITAKRILVIWEEKEEPFWDFCYWDGQRSQSGRVAWGEFGDLWPPNLARVPFMMASPTAGSAQVPSGRYTVSRADISQSLVARFQIRSFAAAPFQNTTAIGHVLVLDPESLSPGLLSLAAIVASRIAAELEHHALRLQMAAAALLNERARIARDLHDSLLQDLTAAKLRLRSFSERVEAGSSELISLEDILSRQQKRIRSFVEEVNPKRVTEPTGDPVKLIEDFATELSKQWQCEILVNIRLTESLPETLSNELCLILAEATANAVKHGNANVVSLRICGEEQQVRMSVQDNGTGMAKLSGSYNQQELQASGLGPRSILERVEDLQGRLWLNTGAGGVGLELSIPLS